MRPRVPILASYKKIDDYTVAIDDQPGRPRIFPWMMPYILFTSPPSWEKAGKDWAKVATLPRRRHRAVPDHPSCRGSRPTLSRNDAYWDPTPPAKVDQVLLLPIPEANTRLAALRSGQVDWIEVPPPDGMPSLKQAAS